MVQINDDNYEDLTFESMTAILDALAARRDAAAGPADRPPDQLPRGRADDLARDGVRKSRLPGGMVRTALAALLLLAACQRAETPANQAEAAPPKQSAAEGDVRAAERLVLQRLGAAAEVRFAGATRSASDGVRIVCGRYDQAGVTHRYIVVGDQEAFVESQMAPGEMDRAVAEFCREGTGNGPARRTPAAGEKG